MYVNLCIIAIISKLVYLLQPSWGLYILLICAYAINESVHECLLTAMLYSKYISEDPYKVWPIPVHKSVIYVLDAFNPKEMFS